MKYTLCKYKYIALRAFNSSRRNVSLQSAYKDHPNKKPQTW